MKRRQAAAGVNVIYHELKKIRRGRHSSRICRVDAREAWRHYEMQRLAHDISANIIAESSKCRQISALIMRARFIICR